MDVWTACFLVISNFIIATTIVGAATHQITWEAGFDCGTWASSQKFIVGDNLIFFSAEPNSVMNVGHYDYKSCNHSSPYATYRTGNNPVRIDQTDLYFVSSVQEYCKSGLKLHVHASPATSATSSVVAGSSTFSSFMYTSVIYVLCLI